MKHMVDMNKLYLEYPKNSGQFWNVQPVRTDGDMKLVTNANDDWLWLYVDEWLNLSLSALWDATYGKARIERDGDYASSVHAEWNEGNAYLRKLESFAR